MLNHKKIYFFLALLLVMACTPTGSYKLKSFFFDGVPNPNEQLSSTATTEVNESVNDSTIMFKAANTVHPPYLDKACMECHSKENMGQPKMEQPQLCYQCHDDFGQSNAFLHGPVKAGYCTQCHQPHKASIEKLLRHNGQGLCLNCHIKDKIVQNRVHGDIEAQSCMACHNPHGGNNSTYLGKNSCFECHDDFTASTAYVHGPVAAGQCSMCHGSHKSSTPKLLVSTDNTLCLNCHNETEVFSSPYHTAEKESTCTSCHNPHSGDAPYFLNLKAP